jgi:hypothetical protein
VARNAFYSFHYIPDNWRASQVRNMGVIEGNKPASDNDWETVTRGGEAAIRTWIGQQMQGRSCAVVLVGSGTANRKWINYEIKKAWNDGKGVLGVHVHRLKNKDEMQAPMGSDPFNYVTFTTGALASTVLNAHSPPFTDSKDVYAHIKSNLAAWIETAIALRNSKPTHLIA